jgi:hypothetical protein
MSNLNNIKKSITNTISAATSVVSVSTELMADTSLYISKSIGATPTVLKELAKTPFSAGKGYLMESEGISAEDAEKRAFKYINQEVSVTIREGGEGAGKLLADLFKEETTNDDNASK